MTTPQTAPAANTARFQNLQLDLIHADDNQVRKQFGEEALHQLAESIKTHGLIQPIVVKPGEGGQHQIIAGERRWRAAQIAGLTDIPTIVRGDLKDTDAAVIQVIENLQRENLTLAETVAGVTRLVEQLGFQPTCQQLAKSSSWVSKYSTVSKLDERIRTAISNGRLTDLEVAHDLNKLIDLHADDADGYMDVLAMDEAALAEVDSYDLPSRENVRDSVQRAKRNLEWQQKRDAENAARAKTETDEQREERLAIIKKEGEAETQRIQRTNAVKKACDELGADAYQKISEALELDDDQFTIRAPWFSIYGGAVPKSPRTASYTVDIEEAGLSNTSRMSELLDHPPLAITLETKITLEQAEKIAAIIGQDNAAFSFSHECTGAQLTDAIARLETPSVASLVTLNSIQQFISEKVRADDDGQIKAADFHAAYVKWCKTKKLDAFTLNDNRYGAAVAEHGIEKHRTKTGYIYRSIKLA